MQARYVILLAVMVLLAGCVSDGGSAVPTDGPTAVDGSNGPGNDIDDEGSGDGAGDDGTDGDGAGSDSASGEWEPFDFDTPATYEYEVFMEGEGEGRIVWDVQSVVADEYTVRMVYEMDGERIESTATGTKDTVMSQFYTNPGGIVLLTTMYQPATWYQDRDLSIGTQWSYSTPQGSASFAITGTESFAGIECSRSEMRVNSTIVHEGCFTPALGLAPYAAWYDEDGTLEMEIVLVGYREN